MWKCELKHFLFKASDILSYNQQRFIGIIKIFLKHKVVIFNCFTAYLILKTFFFSDNKTRGVEDPETLTWSAKVNVNLCLLFKNILFYHM